MTRAADIARSAREQALAAAAERQERFEAERREEIRLRHERHEAEFKAALPILNEWFPGVDWAWTEGGDYGHDTIVTDYSEDWPPSFKLCVRKFAGRVEIRVGDYRADTSMSGYNYFAGREIRCAADLGCYLESRNA